MIHKDYLKENNLQLDGSIYFLAFQAMNADHFPTNLFFLNQQVSIINLYKKNPVLTIFSIAYSNALLIYLQILLDYKKIKTLDRIR